MAATNIEKYFIEDEAQCTVCMDGRTVQSGDFVTIIAKEDGGHSIFYNTDAITMGLALRMCACEFVKLFNELNEEEQDLVSAELSSIMPAAAALGTGADTV